LSGGFAAPRSCRGLVAATAAAPAAAIGIPVVVLAGAVGVWALDAATRAARVGTARAGRPDAA